jgi:hypothetical protein
MSTMDRDQATIRHWLGACSDAALPFERRWTFKALRRVQSDLAQRLLEQRGLFDQACVTGSIDEVELQGAALCRGWAAAARALEAAGEEDDAYQLGCDVATGLKVAIGSQKSAADRVRELHGDRFVWVTPDEVATMLAGVEAFKFVGAVRQFFPQAELVDRYAETGT